jgi:hypothetical protein
MSAIWSASRPEAVGYASEPRAGPDDDRVLVGKFGHHCDRRFLVQFEVSVPGDCFRHRFRNSLDVHLRAGAAGTFSDCLGHLFDM